jgi:hypothetical protein
MVCWRGRKRTNSKAGRQSHFGDCLRSKNSENRSQKNASRSRN